MLTPTRSILTAFTLASLLACSGHALASTPVPSELLDALKDDDFAKREEATTQLIGRADVSLKNLDYTLTHTDLTPEQRSRLLAAAKHRFRTSPRAALGVAFDFPNGGQIGIPEAPEPVRIRQVMAQFPSSRVLLSGDAILSIDGWKVERTGSGPGGVRPFIISHDPGDEVDMEIERAGAVMKVKVQLGNFADLSDQRMLGPSEIEEAWEVRSARFRGADVEPVLPATEHLAWFDQQGLSVVDHERIARTNANRAGEGDGDGPALATGGGQSAGGREIERRALTRREEDFGRPREFRGNAQIIVNNGELIVNGRRIRANVGEQIIVNGPNGQQIIRQLPIREPGPKEASLIDQRASLLTQHAMLRLQLTQIDQQIADPSTSPDTRRMLKVVKSQQTRVVEELAQQIAELNTKINNTKADQQPAPVRTVP